MLYQLQVPCFAFAVMDKDDPVKRHLEPIIIVDPSWVKESWVMKENHVTWEFRTIKGDTLSMAADAVLARFLLVKDPTKDGYPIAIDRRDVVETR